MKKLLLTLLCLLVLAALILPACASQAPAPTSAAPTASAPVSTAKPAPAPSTTAAPAPSATQPAAAAPIVLKLSSFLPAMTPTVRTCVPLLVEAVAKRSNGRLAIQFLGGPEIVAGPGLAEAVSRNVVQMGLVTPGMYLGMVPLGEMWALSELDPDEEVKSGAYAYVDSLHAKVGLKYLARTSYTFKSVQHNIITNKLITRPQEFAGMRIGGSSTILTPFCGKVGASSVIIPTPDFYTSLERNVIDALGDPLQNMMSYQLYEVCKYIVEQGYYRSSALYVVNLDTWNKLPKDLQEVLSVASRDVLYQYMDMVDKTIIPAAFKQGTDKGMKLIKFSDEDNKWFIKQLYDGQWEYFNKQFPEIATKLRPMISK